MTSAVGRSPVPICLGVTLAAFFAGVLSAAAQAQQPRLPAPGQPAPAPIGLDQLSTAVQQQIRALAADKQARTPAQRKISSHLLYTAKSRRNVPIAGTVTTLRSRVPVTSDGRVDVEITSQATKELVEVIEKFGGEILYGSDRSSSVRALVPVDRLEGVAELASVRAIRPTMPVTTHWRLREGVAGETPARPGRRAPSFEMRADQIRSRLRTAISEIEARRSASPAARTSGVGDATSQGDVAHRAAEARNFFGVTGAGVKIGVLSDSVRFLANSQGSGDLPPDVVVLPGQDGIGTTDIGEGTAMLEIVHDLAPGAKLFFATAFGGPESFADNILALRDAGCDIIVDDILYAGESPFQDGPIAAAVNAVIQNGAYYFSSAGNDGNFNDGTSSVWEGDFKKSNATIPLLAGAGELHDFGSGVVSNRAESTSLFILGLYWSDPLGGADNDYDLYILNSALTVVLDASTDVQDGDDDPFEGTFPGAFAGERVVVVRFAGQKRALHLNNYGGQFGIATSGSTHGHNSAAGAFGIAAINVATAGGGPFIGGATNPIELFSSDGFRRVFFEEDGIPFKPGKFLFSNGGELRRKPDLTAADGVETTVPQFELFFGTSAAAPHAAAIAGLLKSARPNIKPNRVRRALQETALDIEAIGRDRDSGFGIVSAFGALTFIDAPPAPFLDLGTIAATPTTGDSDAFIEPGESATLLAQLVNLGGATALDVEGVIATSTPGVTLGVSASDYPNIGSNGQAAANLTPYTFSLSPSAPCGVAPDFTLTASYSNGLNSPQIFSFKVPTGAPGSTSSTTSYAGPVVPIPDNNPAGTAVPLMVSGVPGAIASIAFRFDGSACTAAAGATTVGLDHTWVGDLVITLTSPHGTTVTLASRPGGVLNSGNNFCNTVLDDGAATSIQAITSAGAPYTGSFQPASPLAALTGEDPNGTWTLRVSDNAALDVGSVRAFSLVITPFVCDGPPAPIATASPKPASAGLAVERVTLR
jgi:subtilisin-like proprotein convertase family protein